MSAVVPIKNKIKTAEPKYIIDRKSVLGEGIYGKVYLAKDTVTGKAIACKVVPKPELHDATKWCNIKGELETVSCLPIHQNLPQIYSVNEDEDNYYIFMEYIEGQTLSDIMDEIMQPLKEDVALKYFKQIVAAVEACHQNNIIHRDIKLENIMVTKDGVVKLIDFGFSERLFDENGQKLAHNQHCGSICYAAPELVLEKPYFGDAVDVWCMGITLYCLIEGDFPFHGFSQLKTFERIVGAKVVFYEKHPDALMEIIQRMLSKNWSNRPTVEQIKNCSWLS